MSNFMKKMKECYELLSQLHSEKESKQIFQTRQIALAFRQRETYFRYPVFYVDRFSILYH